MRLLSTMIFKIHQALLKGVYHQNKEPIEKHGMVAVEEKNILAARKIQ